MSSNWYQQVREPRESFNQWRPTIREVVDHIFLRRIRNGQNVIGAVCGETGSGKSWSALRIGEMVDPSFGIDSIAFSTKEFLEMFGSHSRGDVIVFDEGQEWSARRAMSKRNVELSDIMTMLRFTQVNVLFTVPNINLVDINLRRLMHIYFDVRPVDRVSGPKSLRNKSVANIYMIRHRRDPGGQGERMSRPFPVVPIVRGGKTQRLKIDSIQLLAPSPDLVEAYEAKKRRVFHARLDRAISTLGGPTSPPRPPAPSAEGAPSLEELM